MPSCRIALDARECADAARAFRLLRACSKRPRCRRAAKKRDEFAPLHAPSKTTLLCVKSLALRDRAARAKWTQLGPNADQADVRFGSLADMCSATRYVRFVPIADIAAYSITSSICIKSDSGNSMPSALAVLRLMISSTFVCC